MKPVCSSACLITYGTSRLLSATFFPKRKDKWLNLPCFMFIWKWRLWLHNDARLVPDVTGAELNFTVSFLWEPSGVQSMQFHRIDQNKWLLRQFHTFPTVHGQILLSVGHFSWMHFGQKYFAWTPSLMERNSRWWKGIPEVLCLSLSLIFIITVYCVRCFVGRMDIIVE